MILSLSSCVQICATCGTEVRAKFRTFIQQKVSESQGLSPEEVDLAGYIVSFNLQTMNIVADPVDEDDEEQPLVHKELQTHTENSQSELDTEIPNEAVLSPKRSNDEVSTSKRKANKRKLNDSNLDGFPTKRNKVHTGSDIISVASSSKPVHQTPHKDCMKPVGVSPGPEAEIPPDLNSDVDEPLEEIHSDDSGTLQGNEDDRVRRHVSYQFVFLPRLSTGRLS